MSIDELKTLLVTVPIEPSPDNSPRGLNTSNLDTLAPPSFLAVERGDGRPFDLAFLGHAHGAFRDELEINFSSASSSNMLFRWCRAKVLTTKSGVDVLDKIGIK
jgi:hypothetical protein